MKPDEKIQIRDLLFTRVKDPAVRSRIVQLASALADDDDDYWAAVYHYALPENVEDLNEDYEEFVTNGDGSVGYTPEGKNEDAPADAGEMADVEANG